VKSGLQWTIGTFVSLASVMTIASPGQAYGNSVNWLGNGVDDDETFEFDSEICGVENGAPVDGPYVYWVLTASKASAADIEIDGLDFNETGNMDKKGKGSFHYLQQFDAEFVVPTSAFATYNGPNDKKVNLVISHGCGDGEDPGTDCSVFNGLTPPTFDLYWDYEFPENDVGDFRFISPVFSLDSGSGFLVTQDFLWMLDQLNTDAFGLLAWTEACTDLSGSGPQFAWFLGTESTSYPTSEPVKQIGTELPFVEVFTEENVLDAGGVNQTTFLSNYYNPAILISTVPLVGGNNPLVFRWLAASGE